jgi:hypothetical protein
MRCDGILDKVELGEFAARLSRPTQSMRGRGQDVTVFLQAVLAAGPVAVSDIDAAARAAGLLTEYQRATVSKLFKRAKSALRIKSVREGFGRDGEWNWVLPPPAMISAPEGKDHLSAEPTVPVTRSVREKSVVYGDSSASAEPGSPKVSLINEVEIGLPPEFRDVVGVPRSWLEGVARLDRQVHRYVVLHRWRQFVDDCHRFIVSDEGWARRAADLGWDEVALFGCSPINPLGYLGIAGLLWTVAGGRIIRLRADGADIQSPGAARAFDAVRCGCYAASSALIR